ncbi:MAG TPA: YbaN family protein [Vicinamibacterales bacterium]|nr:YbaN family protein [Vicinamibacterales bacterium]
MSSRLMKALLVVCGTLCVALGVLGIFLPLLPTTVFLLMAAACYARSSDRFYRRLINSRWLGSYIRNHREGRGMKRRDKWITLAMLWIGIGATMIWTAEAWWLRLLLLAIAAGVTAHVVKLPTFQPTSLSQPNETPLR